MRTSTLYVTIAVALLASGLQGQDALMSFHRGDVNGDSVLNISDPVSTFGWLFLGEATPGCLDAVDSNDDGATNLSDGIFSLNFLFVGGQPPPYPGPETCDRDPTEDDLGCESYAPCTCGGFIGKPCPKGETCDFPAGFCSGADMQGACVPLPEACPKNLDPVCGCDGITYANDCERLRAGVSKDHDGECKTGCSPTGARCEKGTFCELPDGVCDSADVDGECVEIPVLCSAVKDPVCGCDGRTYGNDCERRNAQVSKRHDGPCEALPPREED